MSVIDVKAPPRALVLKWAGASCVVLATDVIAIDHDGAQARVKVWGEPVSLATAVPGAIDAPEEQHPMRFIVRARRRYVAFRVAANVEVRERVALYALPKVLKHSCAPWVRGMAMVPGDDGGSESPLPWIDLGVLAESRFGHETHEQCAEGASW